MEAASAVSGPPPGEAGPLAEYGALRAEILQNSQQMANLFALHVGAAGAVLGIALATPAQRYVALVVPITSFLLCARYSYLYQGILHAAQYLDEVLAFKVPGGLGWESWLRTNIRSGGRRLRQWPANLVAFSGTALLAWAFATPSVFDGHVRSGRVVLVAAWLVSLAFTVMTYAVLHRVRLFRNPT